MVGVMLGVMALIITISVMNGFRANLLLAVTGTTPHIQIFGDKEGMTAAKRKELTARIGELPGIESQGPYLSGQAFISVNGEYRALILRGVDPHAAQPVTDLRRFLRGQPFRADGIITDSRVAERIMDELSYPPPSGERAGMRIERRA